MTDDARFRVEVLLSIQRALLDLVTPRLRGVAIRLTFPMIEARFIYESVGDEEREFAAEVGTNVIADFLPPVDISFEAVAIPTGVDRILEPGEEWVYRRWEPDEVD